MITEPAQAETILQSGQADVVLLARELLTRSILAAASRQNIGEKIKAPVSMNAL